MGISCSTNSSSCSSKFGCPDFSSGICPDFRIKRHDTRPAFELTIKDCNLPINLDDTVVEATMWANAKFKSAVAKTDTYFALADNIGFEQSIVGDIIVVTNQVRAPEQMLVTGFDEDNKLIRVQRSYNGSEARAYKRGSKIKIFRFINSVGSTEMTLTDILQVDGTTTEDVLTKSKLIYEWDAQDTCVPGCYYLELKLLKMSSSGGASLLSSSYFLAASVVPSFVTPSAATLGCELGDGVEWVRRFPVDKEGFLIEVIDSPTSEILV